VSLLLLASTGIFGCGGESTEGSNATPPEPPATAGPARELPRERSPARPPALNLIVITLDTVRADALGAYGQSRPTTPHLDRLASEGVLFEQVMSSAPSTIPSHATIFTGKYPYAHGARSNFGHSLSRSNLTLAEVLAREGYRTAAEIAAEVLQPLVRLDQGFEHYRHVGSPGVQKKRVTLNEDGVKRSVEEPIRTAADITRRALSFVRQNRERKFFLWLHYFDPHHPYSAPPRFHRRIPDSPYHAEVAAADEQIGAVIDELRRLGLAEHTLVVFTGDHGEGLGDHGEWTHIYYTYESTMRVPLIFWGPRELLPGWRVQSLVRSVDIAPTVLDLLALPPLPDAQGVSLRPLLVGEREDLALTAYGESIEWYTTFATSPLRVIREGRWKYIHKVNPELYDIESDPGEEVNRFASEPEVAARLVAALEEMLSSAPGAPQDAVMTMDKQTRERLAALGYIGGALSESDRKTLDSMEVFGHDAGDLSEDIHQMALVGGHMTYEHWHKAIEVLRPLAKKHPESVPILERLTESLKRAGELTEAVPLARRLLELRPDETIHYRVLATLLEAKGEDEEAIDLMFKAIDLEACDVEPRMELYLFLHQRKRYADLNRMMAHGFERCPESPWNLNGYAWVLATSPEDPLRDGAKAVAIAKRALAQTAPDATDPSHIDTLAAAFAEAGDFAAAIDACERAIEEARAQGSSEQLIETFQGHLEDYRSGRPVRDP
jgi:arylsulfatase A-like enzyme